MVFCELFVKRVATYRRNTNGIENFKFKKLVVTNVDVSLASASNEIVATPKNLTNIVTN